VPRKTGPGHGASHGRGAKGSTSTAKPFTELATPAPAAFVSRPPDTIRDARRRAVVANAKGLLHVTALECLEAFENRELTRAVLAFKHELKTTRQCCLFCGRYWPTVLEMLPEAFLIIHPWRQKRFTASWIATGICSVCYDVFQEGAFDENVGVALIEIWPECKITNLSRRHKLGFVENINFRVLV
jgi:hypothetical protein